MRNAERTVRRFALFGIMAAVAACDDTEPTRPVVQFFPSTRPSSLGTLTDQFGVVMADMDNATVAQMRQAAGIAKRAGVTWSRLVFDWPRLQSAPGQWTAFADTMHWTIDALADSGIKSFVTLQNTAPWACFTDACRNDRSYAPDNYFAWQDWVRQAVAEYPTVDYWGIWNEPSGNFMKLDPGEDRVWTYRDLVIWAADPIHAAGKYVVAPEDGDTTFLEQFLKWPYIQDIDVISIHSYWASFGNERLVAKVDSFARRELVPHGRPIWLAETGLAMNDRFAGGGYGGYPYDNAQATHTTRVLQRMTAGRISNWKKSFIFHFHAPRELNHPLPEHRLVADAFGPSPVPRLAYECLKNVALQVVGESIPNACTEQSECSAGDWQNGCMVPTIRGPERPLPNQSCTFAVTLSNANSPWYYRWERLSGASKTTIAAGANATSVRIATPSSHGSHYVLIATVYDWGVNGGRISADTMTVRGWSNGSFCA